MFSAHVTLGPDCRCAQRSPSVPSARPVPTVRLAGQLHGRGQLARDLGRLQSTTDAELVAAAWTLWGAGAPAHLQGEYAAAVVEAAPGRVTLVRDHIGTHPLLWHSDGRCVHFATSMAALLDALPSTPFPDEATVAGFLVDPRAVGARTFVADVHMVEPGHLVVVEEGRVRTERWWRPEELPQQMSLTRADLVEEVRALVDTAVADRLPEGQAIGVHLSGGLDSTLVALVAVEILAGRGAAIRGGYAWSPPVSELDPDLDPADERARLERLAVELGSSVRLSARDASHVREFLSRPVELEGTADVFDELPILEASERDGVKVLLSGWGGDELLSTHAPGMPAHLFRSRRPRAALGAVRRLNGGVRPFGGLLTRAWRHLLVPLLPDPLYRLSPFYGDHYRGGCYVGPALRPYADAVRSRPGYRITSDPRADVLRLLRYGHIGERMATWSAWSAPHGIRHTYPLTDRRLMERILTAPTEFLWGDGRPRYPARVAVGQRTRLPMSKNDPANERQRMRIFRDTWRLLGDEVRAGRMQDDCDWLDMPALRRDLLRGPSGKDIPDALTMARMMPALRVLDLWRRST
jgi:asparagine synthase (glutamine-hydrolysing)